MVVLHWVIVDFVVIEVHPQMEMSTVDMQVNRDPWMEMNTVDMDEMCFFMVVNPSVNMHLRVVNMHPHMKVNMDLRMEMNTVDMDEGCFFMVVNLIMHPYMAEMSTADMDVVAPFMLVHHYVMVDSVVMKMHLEMEMNTVDRDAWYSVVVVSPSVKMNLWVVYTHPHMVEMSPMDMELVRSCMVVHHWVMVDSVLMEVHPQIEMNTMDVHEGYSVNPSVKMNLWLV